MQRLSPLATRSTHDKIAGIGKDLIQAKIGDAKANDRLREIHCFHANTDETLHRMLNAIEPESYVRPHRHLSPPKPESILVLSGSLAVILFQEDGTPDWDKSLLLSRNGEMIGADIRAGVWHTLVVLEPGTVIFEAKPGPYSTLSDKDFASWAPEDSSAAAKTYLSHLMSEVRRHMGGGRK